MKHFDEIIAYIENTVNLEETLVIVTADHSHAFELVGQPGRFQSAIGLDQYYSNNVSLKLQIHPRMFGEHYNVKHSSIVAF